MDRMGGIVIFKPLEGGCKRISGELYGVENSENSTFGPLSHYK